MCMTDPAQIIEITHDGTEAIAQLEAGRRRLSLALFALEDRPIEAGDWVLANAGIVVERIEEEEAMQLVELLRTAKSEKGAP